MQENIIPSERKKRIDKMLEYHKIVDNELTRLKGDQRKAFIREMVCTDVYFLMYYVLGRKDVCYEEWEKGEKLNINELALSYLGENYPHTRDKDGIWVEKGLGDYEYESNGKIIERYYRPFLFERCNEVQKHTDGYLDIWSRDHYKTTIITYAMTIQEILKNPEVTICIYSYNISTAQKMLTQIKNDLQSNQILLSCFPDILFENVNATSWKDDKGKKHKMEWSDKGFNVKRRSNPKEHTLECSGLVTGQKTGGHYNLLIYDDTVTPESVMTPSQIQKTTSQFKMSLNTGSTANMRIRLIGTRYSRDDTYETIMHEHIAKGRVITCTTTGDKNVYNSVLYTPVILADKLSRMTGFVADSQMFCDPTLTESFKFEREWIPERVPVASVNKDDYNWYIIVDPARNVTKDADYTVMWVVGMNKDRKYYFADLIRDKLTLTGKKDKLFSLVSTYTTKRGAPTVFYENVSMQSDVQYMEEKMSEAPTRFSIISASGKPRLKFGTVGQNVAKWKDLRIQALEPLFKGGRVVFTDKVIRTNWQGQEEDMLDSFFNEEYDRYPSTYHDDGLDAMSRIADLETGVMITPPIDIEEIKKKRELYNPYKVGSYRVY